MDLLRSIFDSKPEELYALIWTLPDKRSYFFNDLSSANKQLSSLQDKDVYLGVGLHKEPHSEGRGTKSDITALTGIGADLDVRETKNYFRTFDEAADFLLTLPHPPTDIINSGGGLQPWWLFKEPLSIATEEERGLAERYTKGWIKFLSEAAQKTLDSVGDITRVLRAPGTLNHKYKPARKVKQVGGTELFYNPSDFDEWLLAEAMPGAKFEPSASFADNLSHAVKALEQLSPDRADIYEDWYRVGLSLFSLDQMGLMLWKMWSSKSHKYLEGDCEKKWDSFSKTKRSENDAHITLGSLYYWAFEDSHKDQPSSISPDPRAEISADLLDLLCSDNRKFKQTWDRKRPDFSNQYKYDCSLAAFGIGCMLDHQTIANLIIHHRRRHSQSPEEACKPGYLDRLIARIKDDQKIDQEREQQIHEAQSELSNPTLKDPEPTRQSISKLFGLKIRKLIRCKADPPKYVLILEDDREIELGQINCILSFTLFREKIAAVTSEVLPKSLKLKWDQFAQSLLSIVEDREIGNEATDLGRARAWIIEYLDQNTITPEKQTTNLTNPYFEEGHVHFIGSDIRQWLNCSFGDPVTHIEMGRMLRKVGCEPLTTFRKLGNGAQTSRTAWRVPLTVYVYKGGNS
jgi:hypothetical protein